MLKIQASCFFLLGSDRERQSLHRDLLRRIQHKSAPSAALPAAARPGGDRWRIVPAFLHRASAGAEAAARRRGPTQTGDLSLPGKGGLPGTGRDERAAPGRGAGPARRGGRGRGSCAGSAFSCPRALRRRLLRPRQSQSAVPSPCPCSEAAAGAPTPKASSASLAAPSTLGDASAGPPNAGARDT